MKPRFKKGDNVCYVDKSFPCHATIMARMPRIRWVYIKECRPCGYELYDGTIVLEPFVYTNEGAAHHEHATVLLSHLKEVTEVRDSVIEKLKEYGIIGFSPTDHADPSDLEDLINFNNQVEHIRSIPADQWTPAMKAVMQLADRPSVECP